MTVSARLATIPLLSDRLFKSKVTATQLRPRSQATVTVDPYVRNKDKTKPVPNAMASIHIPKIAIYGASPIPTRKTTTDVGTVTKRRKTGKHNPMVFIGMPSAIGNQITLSWSRDATESTKVSTERKPCT